MTENTIEKGKVIVVTWSHRHTSLRVEQIKKTKDREAVVRLKVRHHRF